MSETPNSIEGPGKGKPFFDRAKTVAESGNYDYAIDMIIEGLNREPELIKEHEFLYNISLRRKMAGGKPAGGLFGGTKTPLKGKTPKDQMLNSEWLLAKDPGNVPEMMKLMRAAAAGGYAEFALWFSKIASQANRTTKKMEVFTELIKILKALPLTGPKKIEALQQALQVLIFAKELKPDDMDIQSMEKDLAAQITFTKSFENKEDDFKASLKSGDETKKLMEEDSLIKSDTYKMKIVADAKADYDRNPREHQHIQKYGKALADTEIEELETQAVELYMKAYNETKTYRYKSQADDIRIKQVTRNYRLLRDALKMDPEDTATQAQVIDIQKERLKLELEVFGERVIHYPTEVAYQFQYGRRLFDAKRYDESIQAFQFAQNNPRFRAEALFLLGRAFYEQNHKQEAAETLKRAIEEYEYAATGDTNSKNYHYWLAKLYEETDRTKEALDIYSKIMQWDFNFLDVRARIERLRKAP